MSRSVVEFVAPRGPLLEYIAEHLRPQDRAELRALGHADFRATLLDSVESSKWAAVALVDAAPACVFGCSEYGSLSAPVGVPWMLGTPAVYRNQRALQRYAPRYIAGLLHRYGHLMNIVHAENTVSIRWLKRLGFMLRPAHPVPPTGALFHVFEMHRHV